MLFWLNYLDIYLSILLFLKTSNDSHVSTFKISSLLCVIYWETVEYGDNMTQYT